MNTSQLHYIFRIILVPGNRLAGIGDGLDGFLARALNIKPPWGAFIDPLADKLL